MREGDSMKWMIVLVVGLGMSAANGQAISPDDAYAKLRDRQQASTQPSAETVAQLREEVAVLQGLILKLKSENESLKAKVASNAKIAGPVAIATQPAPLNEVVAAAIKNHFVVVGMTNDQVQQALTARGIKFMNRSSEERLIGSRRVVYTTWQVGAFYEGYSLIQSEDGIVVAVKE